MTFIAYAIIVLVMLVWTFWRPPAAAAMAMCMYGFEQWAQSQEPFFFIHGTLTNFVVGGIVLLGMFRKWMLRGTLFGDYPRVGVVSMSLFALAAISMLWGVYVPFADHPDVIIGWVTLLLFAIVVPLLISSLDDLRVMLMAFLTLGTAVLLLLLSTASMYRRGIVFQGLLDPTTLQTKTGNPLAIGAMAGYVAIVGILMNFQQLSRFWQFIRWGTSALAMFFAVMTARGAFMAAIAIIALALPASRGLRSFAGITRLVLALCILGGLTSFIFSEFGQGDEFRRKSMWNSDAMHQATETRLGMSRRALEYWVQRPEYWLMGIGNGACRSPEIVNHYPHNVPIEVLVEEGFLGLALLVSLLIMAFQAFRTSYRICRHRADARGLVVTAGALGLYMFVLSNKEGELTGDSWLFCMSIIMGRVANVLRRSQSEMSADENPAALLKICA